MSRVGRQPLRVLPFARVWRRSHQRSTLCRAATPTGSTIVSKRRRRLVHRPIKTAKDPGPHINQDLSYRIKDLIYRLQKDADLKYLSGPHLGTLAPAGWSDPAAIGLFRSCSPLVSPGPLQHFALVMRSAKFMRKHEFARRRTSPISASELYAFSEMVGRVESSPPYWGRRLRKILRWRH